MTNRLRIAFVFVLALSPALAQQPLVPGADRRPLGAVLPEGLTAADVAKIRVVGGAEISPDGKSVAVLTSVPRTASEPNGRSHSELSIVPFEGGQQRVLVPPPGNLSGVQWSGDSQAILFLSKRGDDKEARVWRVPAAGGEPEAVTPAGRAVKAFSATADGKRLAFTEDEPDDPTRAARKKAGFNQEIYEEEWRRVLVRELEREGGKIKTYEVPGSAFEVAYNANGAKLCVTAAPTPSVDDSYMRKDVYVVDVATGSVIKAIDPPGKMGNAVGLPRRNPGRRGDRHRPARHPREHARGRGRDEGRAVPGPDGQGLRGTRGHLRLDRRGPGRAPDLHAHAPRSRLQARSHAADASRRGA